MQNPLKRKVEVQPCGSVVPNHPAYADEVTADFLEFQRTKIAEKFPALAAYKPSANTSWR
jgi:hypothetical protein